MVIKYAVGDVELLYPVKFPYPVNVQEFVRNLILRLTHPVKLLYLVNVSIHKSDFFKQ